MKRIIINLLFLTLVMSIQSMTLSLTPGRLESQLAAIEKQSPSELTLTGTADVRDMAVMKGLPACVATLDLSGLTISPYTFVKSSWYGQKELAGDELPPYTFMGSHISRVILPLHLRSIGEGCFAGSDIGSIDIPSSVTAIGDYAFYDCPRLSSVSFAAGLETLGQYAFAKDKGLTAVDMSKTSLNTLRDFSFADCTSLSEIKLPDGITHIGQQVFARTSIERLNLTALKFADRYALADMPKLSDVTLNPDSELTEGFLFLSPSLMKTEGHPGDFPDFGLALSPGVDINRQLSGAVTIGDFAFAGNKAESVTLSPMTKKIGANAFSGMTNLTSVDVSDCKGSLPETSREAFGGLDCSHIILYVAQGHTDVWRGSEPWSGFDIQTSPTGQSPDVITSGSSISVIYKSGSLSVRSSLPITGIEVVTGDGMALLTASPGSSEYESHIDSMSGIVIVKVTDGKTVRVIKFLD